MIYTTLNKIRAFSPCLDGWKKLLAGLNKTEPDDEPLPLVKIMEISGIEDAVWALNTIDCDREARLFAMKWLHERKSYEAAAIASTSTSTTDRPDPWGDLRAAAMEKQAEIFREIFG